MARVRGKAEHRQGRQQRSHSAGFPRGQRDIARDALTVEAEGICCTGQERPVRDRGNCTRGERDKERDPPHLVLALVEPILPRDEHANPADDEVERHVGAGQLGVVVKTVVLRDVCPPSGHVSHRPVWGYKAQATALTVAPATEAAIKPEIPT